MPDGVRFALLGVVVVCVNVMALVAWYYYLRARRLQEERGDIGRMPPAVVGLYGLPWP